MEIVCGFSHRLQLILYVNRHGPLGPIERSSKLKRPGLKILCLLVRGNDMAQFLRMIQEFFQGVHFDEHSLLLICIGIIIGIMIGSGLGRGIHRRAYAAYRRFRPW